MGPKWHPINYKIIELHETWAKPMLTRWGRVGPTWHRINDKVIELLETCAKPVITKLGPHGTGLMTKSLNCMRHVQNQC